MINSPAGDPWQGRGTEEDSHEPWQRGTWGRSPPHCENGAKMSIVRLFWYLKQLVLLPRLLTFSVLGWICLPEQVSLFLCVHNGSMFSLIEGQIKEFSIFGSKRVFFPFSKMHPGSEWPSG
ncbi:hypothetical protein CEXT_227111 [Caerostris extrusa]|uniref:Uncharacterized protein n=1 Tax=Caerostris extrusa TaxID=172846 RepID=A0AAV4NCL0_CAEEX|nr:hypothetical protein CEXT_227111 [Caerostris extrusa]